MGKAAGRPPPVAGKLRMGKAAGRPPPVAGNLGRTKGLRDHYQSWGKKWEKDRKRAVKFSQEWPNVHKWTVII